MTIPTPAYEMNGGNSHPHPHPARPLVKPTDPSSSLTLSLDKSTSIPDFLNTFLSSPSSSSSSGPSTPHPPLDLITSDQKVTSLLAQLTILTSETSHQLETSIHGISRMVPRLTYDLQYMRESAEGVRRALEGVESRLKSKRSGVVGEGSHPTTTTATTTTTTSSSNTTLILDKLTHLETLRTNLSLARSVLREAESWSTLESLTSLSLSRGEYRQAAIRLSEASESIHMFQRSPREFEVRREVLVSLQNQLEAELDGVLEGMAAIKGVTPTTKGTTTTTTTTSTTSNSTDEKEKEKMDLFELLEIFRLIEREEEYRSIYFNARRRPLMDLWDEAGGLVEFTPTDSITSTSTSITTSSPSSFISFLPQFYALFLSTLKTESSSIKTIFPDPVIALSTFFQTTLEALQPSFARRLSEVVDYYSRPSTPGMNQTTQTQAQTRSGELDVLLQLWRMTVGFGKDVQDILDGLFYSTNNSVGLQGNAAGGGQMSVSPGQMEASPTTINSGRRSRSGSVVQPGTNVVGGGIMGSSTTVTTATTSTTVTGEKRSSSRRYSRSFGTIGTSGLAGIIHEIDPVVPQPTIFPTVESLTGPWDTILYEPFLAYQTDYLGLEKRHMAILLKSESIFIEPAFLAGRAPGERLLAKGSRVIEMAEEALERCTSFTLGFGLADLLEAVAFLMETFLKDAKGLLELKGGVGEVKMVNRSGSSSGYGRDELDELDDLADLDLDLEGMGNDELVTFKLGLGVLRTCSRLKSRIEAYSHKVDSAVSLTSRSLNALAQGAPVAPEAYIAGVTKGAPTLLKQSALHQLALVRLMDGQPSIEGLRPAQRAIIEYTKDAQVATQKAIVAPIQALLAGYPSLPSWAQPDKVARRGELHVPTFSLSPTDTISTVTEGLLDLLRLFEGFANDDGLAFSLGTLPHVNLDLLAKMTQAAHQEAQAPAQHHRTISNVGAFAGMNDKLGLQKSPGPASPPTESTIPAEVVLSTWVSSTTSSLLDNFTAKILPEIKQPLTSHGATQLATDLSYLGNATRAMDVESQHLECWRESCEVKSVVELKELIGRETYTARSPEAVDIARYIAWLRGWNFD